MIDLTPARRTVEALLTDTAQLVRDAQSTSDDALDETTGQLVKPPGDSSTLWTGPVLIAAEGRQAPSGIVGPTEPTVPKEGDPYRALLPLDAPRVKPGDHLVLTVAGRDPQLTGRRFLVINPGQVGTFVVVRTVELELEA